MFITLASLAMDAATYLDALGRPLVVIRGRDIGEHGATAALSARYRRLLAHVSSSSSSMNSESNSSTPPDDVVRTAASRVGVAILYIHTSTPSSTATLSELVAAFSALGNEEQDRLHAVYVLHPSLVPRAGALVAYGACSVFSYVPDTIAKLLRWNSAAASNLCRLYAERTHFVDRVEFLDEFVSWRADAQAQASNEEHAHTLVVGTDDDGDDDDDGGGEREGEWPPRNIPVTLPRWVMEHDASLEKDPIQDYGFYTGSVAADTLGSIPGVSPPPS